MSEIDKYDRYDPYARHSTHKKKNSIPLDVGDEWLKKHGNGLDKIEKEVIKKNGYWQKYGKIPTRKLVSDYFNHYDVLVPSDISDQSCYQNVQTMCNKKVKAGELVRISLTKKGYNPGGGDKVKQVVGYKRA